MESWSREPPRETKISFSNPECEISEVKIAVKQRLLVRIIVRFEKSMVRGIKYSKTVPQCLVFRDSEVNNARSYFANSNKSSP